VLGKAPAKSGIQRVGITFSTSYLETLGGHRRYPASAIRELAATRSYQPVAEDAADPDTSADSGLTDGLLPDAGDARYFYPLGSETRPGALSSKDRVGVIRRWPCPSSTS